MKKQFKLLEFTYLGIWIIPFIIFGKDFFIPKDFFAIFDYDLVNTLIFTLKQSLYSTILALIISIFPALYVTYNKNFLSKVIESTVFIPFFFPVVSTIIAFTIIGNSAFFKSYNLLYSFKGILLANVFYNAPIFVKYLSEGLKKISPLIIETAEIDGASSFDIFFKIKLPLLMPSIIRASFLVFAYCFTSFGVILGIGGIKFSTIEVEIATTLFSSLDFSKAFALGLVQFIFLFLVNFLSDKSENYKLNEEFYIKREKSRFFTICFAYIYMCFELCIVAVSIIFSFIDKTTGKFTFKFFVKLFSIEFNQKYPIIKAFINSSIISSITALLTIVFVYFFLKRFNKWTNHVVLSSLGISNAFLGICLIYMNILYNIPLYFILILGYFMITVPIAYSFLFHSILSFDKHLIEAAKLDGANNFKIFIKIEFPLLKKILFSSFIQIFAVIFTEFTISYTMQIKEYFPTLATLNYDMASNRYFAESTALGALNTLIIISLFLISNFILKKDKTNDIY